MYKVQFRDQEGSIQIRLETEVLEEAQALADHMKAAHVLALYTTTEEGFEQVFTLTELGDANA
jgi:hypothetical protein